MSGQLFEIATADLRPTRAVVLASQGIARENLAPRRILDLADQAQRLLDEHVQARGMFRRVEAASFDEIYRGQGLNEEGPIVDVARRARHRALFAVTLGQPVCDTIARLFASHDFALASFLDGAASAMADRAASWMEWHAAQVLTAERDPEDLVLAYSPGYCGWHLSGQVALLDALGPAQKMVQLGPSFLMSPIKSVSGVLLDGPSGIHRVEARYGFCRDCRCRSCATRRPIIDDLAAPTRRTLA